jgi:hypothetical protein
MLDLDHVLVDVPCPRCRYHVEVQLLDARTQVYRWCPCCRGRIHLVEPDGSVSVGIDAVEGAMQSLQETLRRAFG